MDMLKLFESARCVSVPILCIRTIDQAATLDAIRSVSDEHPLVQWDAVRGLTEANKLGKNALAQAKITVENSGDFAQALVAADQLPPRTIVFVHNAHRHLQSSEPMGCAANVQAIANLRDRFKLNFRMLVLLAPQFSAPQELEQDVVIIDHALPGPEELAKIITELYASVKPPLAKPTADVLTKAVEAVSGLSSFATEQVAAMSLTPVGLDLPALWERKRVTIEQTRGLRVWRGTERFDDLVGLDSVKTRLRTRLRAKTPIGCVVFLDEIDKVLANVEQDTTGVRMDQLRTLLTEMENNEWRGMVAVGVAGGGKSAIAKAVGNEAGVPTIALDLGDMEGPHVGESEQMLRQAVAVIKAIGRGHAYLIATSNNASVMRPEMQRRFTDGFFFFDVMTDAERTACWTFYLKKYGLKKQQLPDDTAWTGAEIRNCCRDAWDTDTTLVEAAHFIVPMARSRADEIEKLRQYAHGRFLDASRQGTYVYEQKPMQKMVRAIELPAIQAAVELENVLKGGKMGVS